MAELLHRLGLFAARRAKAVVAMWLIILALAGGAFALFGGTLATSFSIPDTPTQQVADRLKTDFPAAAGGTVRLDHLDGPYWRDHYSGAKRVLR